jgi:DNA polymerase-3 subunit delta
LAPKRKAVFVVLGGDSYLAEECLETLLQDNVGGDRGDSVQVLRGDETTWTRILEASRMRSLFVDRRAVVVRGADALKGNDEEVRAYLEDPTPGVTLIFMAAKPDRRRAVWKSILEAAATFSAEPLKGRALRARVSREVQKRGIRLSEEGLEELLERVGQDLRRLMGELDKLAAFGEKTLSAEEVSAVLGRGLAPPLYRLGDAFIARRRGDALDVMERILEEGEAPLRVLATLHRALRQVRGARALLDARARREDFASRLGVPPFKVAELVEAARSWSDGELRGALRALGTADRRLKTSVESRLALTAAVVACAPAEGGARGTREG